MDGASGTDEPTVAWPAGLAGTDPEVVLGDRYRLAERLGSGGMADVFRAEDTLLHRQVAVKVLRDGTDTDSDRARFSAEARTLARLSHGGVVMLLDAGVGDAAGSGTGDADRPYLVMELVEGRTLSQAMSGGPLPLAEVEPVAVQLADALAYAHDRGVVHRDVKPGNVLLGAHGRVKLADFGIARLLGDTVRNTRTGQAIGTAAYLAPEQVTGRDVDGAADVYALGLMLLEALTGARAYPGGGVEAALARLSRQPDVPDDLPAQWRRLLREMTALDPADRPTAAEVADRLRSQPTGPMPVAGDPVSPSVTPTLPGDRWGVVAVVAALLLLVGLVAFLGADGAGADDRLPADTPSELVQPLAELHVAVEGER